MKPSDVRTFIYDGTAPLPRNEKSFAISISCPRCGNAFVPRKPWQTFCSQRCRQAALRTRQTRVTHGMVLDSGASKINDVRSNRPENSQQNQSARDASEQGGRLRRRIIEVEIFGGREWRQAVSSDGTPYEVSRLRPRTLLNGNGSGN